MKKHIILSVILLFCGHVLLSQKLSKGFKALTDKDFVKAEEIFNKAIDKQKDVVAARYGLAVLYADTSYHKARASKTFSHLRFVENRLNKTSQDELSRLEQEYGLTLSKIADMKKLIFDAEFSITQSIGTIDSYNTFMDIYPDAPQISFAKQIRDSMVFEIVKQTNTGATYQYFLDKYPNSNYATETLQLRDKWWLDRYNKIRQDGEMSTLIWFERDNYDFPFPKMLEKDKELATMAVNLNMYEAFTETKRRDYAQYITRAASYSELAFVALQRIIEADLIAKNWKAALDTVRNYQPFFDKNHNKINNLIYLLETQDSPITINTVGSGINTKGSEYAPVITANGHFMYFCGKFRDDNYGGEDIFVSEWKDNRWSSATLIDGINTSTAHEAPLAISADNTELFLYSSSGGGDILTSRKIVAGWTYPKAFHEINSNAWDADVAPASDGKAILFASERPGGYNHSTAQRFHGTVLYQTDIYVSVKTDVGWQEPINLGNIINTPYCERSPFLHPDMKTLYFCSDGHGGLGGLDLFMSKRLNDSSWTQWSEPINMGKMINTPANEWGFRISTDGKTMYFAGINRDNNEDILYFEIPTQMRPQIVVTVSGKVMDINGKPIDATMGWENLTNGEPIGEGKVDPVEGTYFIVLPVGKNYGYFAQKDGYFPVSDNIDVSQITQTTHIIRDIILLSINDLQQKDTSITLNNLFFDTDSYTLKPESFPELNRLANILNSLPNLKIEIAGHTDNQGNDIANQILSENRAKAVTDYLTLQKGCNIDNITAKGYGQSSPIANNNTAQGRSQNRRVELRILK